MNLASGLADAARDDTVGRLKQTNRNDQKLCRVRAIGRRPACQWRWGVVGLIWTLGGGVISWAEPPRTVGPPTQAQATAVSQRAEEALGIGKWIWTTNFGDKQVCRLWRSFTVPATNTVRRATLRMTADNLYRVFLDGREIGQGGNWRSLTDYDLTWLLGGGAHALAVEAQNDGLEGGVILGLTLEYADGRRERIVSDRSWWVVPNDYSRWLRRSIPDPRWQPALEVGVLGQFPWWVEPITILALPPLRPEEIRFWQTGWFLAAVLSVTGVVTGLSLWLAARLVVQTRAEQMLTRERALIARDIHDDLGAGVTQLVLQSEVAQTEFPEGSAARERFQQLAEKGRTVAHTLEEVLWAVNSKRDTLRDFTSYLCKYAQSSLANTPVRCRLEVQPDMPTLAFDLPVRRSLFLAVKEALHNVAKHSAATELHLSIQRRGDTVVVQVADNGRGFDPALPAAGNGLENMHTRLAELGGACEINTAPGAGCHIAFTMPLAHPFRAKPWWRRQATPEPQLPEP